MQCSILSLDPSLRNWGVAISDYSPESGLVVRRTTVIQTKTNTIKPKSFSDWARLQPVIHFLDVHVPKFDFFVAELPTGSQSARAMLSCGVCIGVLSHYPDLIKITPRQVKDIIGIDKPDKKDVIKWVNEKHPNVLDKRVTRAEHEADAVVAAYAALPKIQIRLSK